MSRIIVFEGLDGSGKSTQAHCLGKSLIERGYSVRQCREPGGTPLGEELRTLLKTRQMTRQSQLFLFLAARAQLCEQIARELNSFDVFIFDRFIFSTIAYQFDVASEGFLQDANRIATQSIPYPDRVYYLDVSVNEMRKRIPLPDIIEERSDKWFSEIRTRYELQSKQHQWKVINAEETLDDIRAHILNDALSLIEEQ